MKFRIGYELDYDFPQSTPVILVLNTHYTRVSDLESASDHILISPSVDLRLSRRFRKLVQPHPRPAGEHTHRGRHGHQG
jgi:hypothetical protein